MQPSTLETLRGLLCRRPASRRQLQDLLSSTEPPALPLDPWGRNLLLGLYRHGPRQAWLGRVARERLGAGLGAIGRWGGFEHPEGLSDNRVPGLPDWSFRFHGIGCCLTHTDGTRLDVDFVDGGTDWIGLYFYQAFLRSLPSPEPVEARLRAPEPLAGYWMADVEALASEGLIEHHHRVRLTAAGHRLGSLLAEVASALDAEPSAWARAWLAWVIGDGQWALSQLTGEAPPAEIVAEAERQSAQRISALSEALSNATDSLQPTLEALARFGQQAAETITLRQLHRQPIDGRVSTALAILEAWADPAHIPDLLSLIGRADGTEVPTPHVRKTAIALVMRLTRPDTVDPVVTQTLLRGLQQPAGAGDGEAGFLLALLSPDQGLERLERGVSSESPSAREEAAASLGVIGSPEALAILRRTETREAQEMLACVRGSEPEPAPEPRGEVVMWRGRPKKVYRFEDLRESGWAADSMARLNRRFGAIRQIWLAH